MYGTESSREAPRCHVALMGTFKGSLARMETRWRPESLRGSKSKLWNFGSEISSRSPRGPISDPLNLTVWFARDQHGDPVQAEMSINVSDDRDPLAVAVSSDGTPSFNSLLIISLKAVKSSRQTLSMWRSEGRVYLPWPQTLPCTTVSDMWSHPPFSWVC